MARGDRERARIVDFWRAVELFEPQKVDQPNPRSDTPVSAVEPGRPLPWEPGHPVKQRPVPRNAVRRHTIHLGVFKVEETHEILTRAFGSDPKRGDQRPRGETALAAFEVDDHGQALLGTQAVSTCGWAIGRTLSPGPRSRQWLEGFDWAEERFGELCDWLVADPGPAPAQALLDLVEAGSVTAPLVKLWNSVRASLKASAEAAGTLPSAGAEVGTLGPSKNSDEGKPPVAPPGEGGRVLRYRELETLQRVVSVLLGVHQDLKLDIRIKSHLASAKDDETEQERQEFLLAQLQGATEITGDPYPETTEAPILNSFIAQDLISVSESVRKGEYGAALRAYLSSSAEVASIPRQDIREEKAEAVHRVLPERTPAGRWPAKDTHPLVLSQQIAVNSINQTLGERPGLFAVNGPPGTGKTTLLRDLIAQVVVDRARVLEKFSEPWEAFGPWAGWSTERGRISFPCLSPELAGHEIVVASANNGAVDNVTKEIPAREAIDDLWAHADHFSATATNMLDQGQTAWGTLAAQLGNAKNRRTFVSRFWWGNRPDRSQGEHGMRDLLKELEEADRADREPAQRQWREAITTFRRRLRERDRLVAERASAARALAELPAVRRRLQKAETNHSAWEAEEAQAQRAHETAGKLYREASDALARVESERSTHWEFKPGFWDILFSLGRRLRAWQHADDQIVERLNAAKEDKHHRAGSVTEAVRAHERAEAGLRRAQQALHEATSNVTDLESETAAAAQRWPGHLPEKKALAHETTRELSAPWSDPELTRARTEVFLAALGLHEAFVRAVPGEMAKILRAATDVLSGKTGGAKDEAVREAVRGLFLVVPVVSSTFASFARTFKAFDNESLGWLLIDEAGQATPQQAVGALWRSRRAVVVGDPLQLEPVTTLPEPSQEELRRRFGIEERWLPARTSVQALADSVTPLGTFLERGEGEALWVGSPLRVHRRCDDPMFTVSNSVAYNGMMVFGTPGRQEWSLPPSQWIHMPEQDSVIEGHWRSAEGGKLDWLLDGLFLRGHAMEDVFVLAPFREVAEKIAGIAKGHGVRSDRAGTIHTSQGKEASVVVFVLGGAPGHERALDWAAQTPNLLNVAASRAKRRLYVIGDHKTWAHRHHFTTLSRYVPLREPFDR